MTGTADDSAPARARDAACHQAAKELRLQHPRWIVLWISHTGRYHGYPLYTQRSVIQTAEQPAELAALMEQADHAAGPATSGPVSQMITPNGRIHLRADPQAGPPPRQ